MASCSGLPMITVWKNRSMVEPLFVKEHIQTMKPYIQKTVDDLLDAMVAKGCKTPVDLVDKFALPVPSYVSNVSSCLEAV
jgi:fungal nitric oxide reductase